MGTTTSRPDDEMPSEIDFSTGVRGMFFKPGAEIQLPVYLEARAQAKGIELAHLVNELLKKDIELIEAAS